MDDLLFHVELCSAREREWGEGPRAKGEVERGKATRRKHLQAANFVKIITPCKTITALIFREFFFLSIPRLTFTTDNLFSVK